MTAEHDRVEVLALVAATLVIAIPHDHGPHRPHRTITAPPRDAGNACVEGEARLDGVEEHDSHARDVSVGGGAVTGATMAWPVTRTPSSTRAPRRSLRRAPRRA
jgi:hypothetical protein